MKNEGTLELRNSILFDSVQKVEIPSTTKEVHLVEAVTANQEFSRFGFSLDVKGIMNLAHNTPQDIAAIKNIICDVMESSTGLEGFRGSEPFYPNFPEEVMEKDDFELAINAILYYAFSQTDDKEMTAIAHEIRDMVTSGPEDRIEREVLPVDTSELKIVASAGPTDLEGLLHDRTQAMSISSDHLKDIEKYANEYKSDWTDRIFGSGDAKDLSIPSHETRANIAHIAYRTGDKDAAREMMPNAEDVLRFAAVLSEDRNADKRNWRTNPITQMDANLSFEAKDAKFNLSRADKTTVKEFLDKSPDLFTSMWHRPDMWEKLMSRLDTKDSRFPRMEKAFDNLRQDHKVDERGVEIKPSAGQELEKLMDKIRIDPQDSKDAIEAFADKYPKVFTRNIERIGRDIAPNSESVKGLCNGIEKSSSIVPAGQLLKLEKHVEKADGWDYRIFSNQKGGIHVVENDSRPINIGIKSEIVSALDRAIDNNLTKGPVGKVFIAPELSGVTIPLRNQRDASDGATLTKYSVLEGKAENNIVAFGIYWKNDGKERADIDLSVTGFKEGYKDPVTVYFGNLKEDWAVHSGDYTTGVIAPEINGAVEYVFVDKTKCEELGIRHLVPEVHGFNIPFSQAESVRFCFMEKQGSLTDLSSGRGDSIWGEPKHAPMFKGELINPTEVNTSYRLTQDTRATVPLIYDVKDDKYTWVDKDISVRGISTAVDKVSRDKTSIVLYESKHNDYPSIGELAERYVKANGGEIVKDMKDADLIFSFGNIDQEGLGLKEGVEIISSLELDKISSELCNAVEVVEKEEKEDDDVDTGVVAAEKEPEFVEVQEEDKDDNVDESELDSEYADRYDEYEQDYERFD